MSMRILARQINAYPRRIRNTGRNNFLWKLLAVVLDKHNKIRIKELSVFAFFDRKSWLFSIKFLQVFDKRVRIRSRSSYLRLRFRETIQIRTSGSVTPDIIEPRTVYFMCFILVYFCCQDLDQFMREMEEVHRQREAEKAASLQQRLSRSVASLSHRIILCVRWRRFTGSVRPRKRRAFSSASPG